MNRKVQVGDKIVLRSIIKKYFPPDLLINLDLISREKSQTNTAKIPYILEELDKFGVPYGSKLGSGTNRYGILVDGYVVKIALDAAGKIDNRREFKYVMNVLDDVSKAYETVKTGIVLVSEYITPFSIDDFYDNQENMRKILKKYDELYLIGDVGVSTDNYINWGTRMDGSIAMLDYAYIYSTSFKNFMCTCEDEGNLEYDADHNYMICPFCRKKWSFGDIRRRITKDEQEAEIGDVMELGYVLRSPEEEHIVEAGKSVVKMKKPKKKKEPIVKPVAKDEDRTYEENIEYLMQFDEMVKSQGEG